MIEAQIAQLVEQRTENPRVTGSIPVLGIVSKQPERVFIYNNKYPKGSLDITTTREGSYTCGCSSMVEH